VNQSVAAKDRSARQLVEGKFENDYPGYEDGFFAANKGKGLATRALFNRLTPGQDHRPVPTGA
jgi:hypothetical protein